MNATPPAKPAVDRAAMDAEGQRRLMDGTALLREDPFELRIPDRVNRPDRGGIEQPVELTDFNEVGRRDQVVRTQNMHPLDDGSKLSDVSRPCIRPKCRQGVIAESARRLSVQRGELVVETVQERRHLIDAVTQCANTDGNNVKSEQEIPAEPPVLNCIDQIHICRGDDANINRQRR